MTLVEDRAALIEARTNMIEAKEVLDQRWREYDTAVTDYIGPLRSATGSAMDLIRDILAINELRWLDGVGTEEGKWRCVECDAWEDQEHRRRCCIGRAIVMTTEVKVT